jgi:hypothetical protein
VDEKGQASLSEKFCYRCINFSIAKFKFIESSALCISGDGLSNDSVVASSVAQPDKIMTTDAMNAH